MTVCLAVRGDRGRSLVTVADTKLSLGSAGSGFGDKIHPIHNHWQLLYATDDMTVVENVLQELIQTPALDYTPKQYLQMRDFLMHACEAQPCTPTTAREFLLAGFDDRGFSHITVVNDRADQGPIPIDLTTMGYAAIGSGGDKALFTLGLFGHRIDRTLAETLYGACAAKFFTEDIDGVNAEVVAYVLKPGGVQNPVHPEVLAAIRVEWERHGQLPIPITAIQSIQQYLDSSLTDQE